MTGSGNDFKREAACTDNRNKGQQLKNKFLLRLYVQDKKTTTEQYKNQIWMCFCSMHTVPSMQTECGAPTTNRSHNEAQLI